MPAAFDERSPKYRHCCCHIRAASTVLGILQLASVLFVLAQHSVRSVIADSQLQDRYSTKHSDHSSSSATTPSSDAVDSSSTNNNNNSRWLGPGATTPLVTWAVCETLFLGFAFYGMLKIRHWLMIPHLFLQVVTVIVCMILNVMMVCVLAWHPDVSEVWYFLITSIAISFLYEYGLVVFIRCYRYLRDKEIAMARASMHGVFVLPSGGGTATANGGAVDLEAINETRMYSDLPPEYATAITMMTVEEAKRASRISNATTTTNLTNTTPISSPTAEQEETRTKEEEQQEQEVASVSTTSVGGGGGEGEGENDNHHHDKPQKQQQEPTSEQEEQQNQRHSTKVITEEEDDSSNAPPPTYEQARELQNVRLSYLEKK